MKKTFYSIAYAAIITLGTITISSCEKENTEIANGINKETFTDKSANANSIYQEAKLATLNICEKIDAAFALDSVSFKTVCEAEDFDGFMDLTGITEQESEIYNILADSVYNIYISENPEFNNEAIEPCIECTNNPLTKLYTITSKAKAVGGLTSVVSGLSDSEIAVGISGSNEVCKKIKNKKRRYLCFLLFGLIDFLPF